MVHCIILALGLSSLASCRAAPRLAPLNWTPSQVEVGGEISRAFKRVR